MSKMTFLSHLEMLEKMRAGRVSTVWISQNNAHVWH